MKVDGVPWPWLAAGLALLLVFPLLFPLPFHQHVVIMTLLYASLGVAWNILGGYAGQVSLGHGVYYGIGAYTVAFLFINFQVSPWLSWPAALALAGATALVIGLPTFRLRGHYFVLASVFIAEAAYIVVSNWSAVGGAIGLEYPVQRGGDWTAALWRLQFHGTKLPYYYGALALFLGALFVAWRIQHWPLGYYLRAIREEQDAAQSLGIDVGRYKLHALLISAAFTTLGGIFYAQYVLYVEPVSTVSLIISVEIAFIAIFGGIGTLWGPVLGAFVLVPLSELLRAYFSGRISLDASALSGGGVGAYLDYYLQGGGGNVDLMVYGLLIMLVARFQPNGVLGFLRRLD
jgi:branched-chain amino acid transport system permease protein